MRAHPHLQMQTRQQPLLKQHLMMSAHMQQALHLLQLPLMELESFIEEQIVLNPILELSPTSEKEESEPSASQAISEEQEITIDERDLSILQRLDEEWQEHFAESDSFHPTFSKEEEKFKSYLEQSVSREVSLYEKLLQQAHDTFETQKEIEIATLLIGSIDPCGFLKTPLSSICHLHGIQEEEAERILKEIQTFEPYGIGASSIQEALLIQLICLHKEKSLAYRLIKEYYKELLHNQLPLIQKQLKCSYTELQQAIEKDIAPLDLHPGTHFSAASNYPLIPDVTLRQENDRLVVDVDRDYISSLRINHRYLKMLKDPSLPAETKQFIKQHLLSARWLMRNLHQRYSTLERIAQSLAEKQSLFLTQPGGQLVPLTMKTLANELGVHESTIARSVAHKYIQTPRGLFPLRFFFTTRYVSVKGEDLSSTTVKEALLELIKQEDKAHPLSDEALSLLLQKKGIPCARRTIAKYRHLLKIGNTRQRRQFL